MVKETQVNTASIVRVQGSFLCGMDTTGLHGVQLHALQQRCIPAAGAAVTAQPA